jgi:hypothetical protein
LISSTLRVKERETAMGNPSLIWLTEDGLDTLIHEQSFLESLQLAEPKWEPSRTRTWNCGGCYILADALHRFLFLHGLDCEITTVYGTWDEEPLHAVVKIGDYILDKDGLQHAETILKEWEDEMNGGAIYCDLEPELIKRYDIPVDSDLSKKMADFLESTFKEA